MCFPRVLAIALVVVGLVAACDPPCVFHEYCSDGQCQSCTPGTYGSHEHCEQYNATLPWKNTNTTFKQYRLHALAFQCFDYEQAPSESAVAVDLCTNTTDGNLTERVVVSAEDSTVQQYTPQAESAEPVECARGEYRSATDTSMCITCLNNTTTEDGNATSELDCNACELGYKWVPVSRSCERCKECYTTRAHSDAVAYTRAEFCSPCSVWSADYSTGQCQPDLADKCVLHVPFADVHEVHRTLEHNDTSAYQHVLCTYAYMEQPEKYSQGQTGGKCEAFLGSSETKVMNNYLYENEELSVHALFRPQRLRQLSDEMHNEYKAYMEDKDWAWKFTYTIGTALPGSFSSYWERQEEIDSIPIVPFEISGSYVIPLHNFSHGGLAYYDLARAYYEYFLRGLLGPRGVECEKVENQFEDRMLQTGILFCSKETQNMLNYTDFGKRCDNDDKICTAMDVECIAGFQDVFCAKIGDSYNLWKETNLYLYNATREYSAMNEAVQKWLDGQESTEIGGGSETLECGVTNMQLEVTWVNKEPAANATVLALEVFSNTALRLDPDIKFPLVLPAGNHTFKTNATVRLNAPVNVRIHMKEDAAVGVSIQIDGVTVDTTKHDSDFEHENEFNVCENVLEQNIATIQSLAAFEGAHTVLNNYLCAYD